MKQFSNFFALILLLLVSRSSVEGQVFHSQANPLWSGHNMCQTYTIGQKGCLVADIAMNYNGNWPPDKLNGFLKAQCSYDINSQCGLDWGANLPAGLKYQTRYYVSSSNYLSEINSWMVISGKRVVLEFIKPNGGKHWVLIYSVNGNPIYQSSFVVYDPANHPFQYRTLGSSAYTGWTPNRIAVYYTESSSCLDSYEPNNGLNQTWPISTGTTYNAVLCTSTDMDFYKFYTTSFQPYFKVTLQNLPTNYELYVLKENSNGTYTLVGSSANSCKASETVICNQYSTGGTYIVHILGFNNYSYHARLKYALKAIRSSTPLYFTNDFEIETRDFDDDLSTYDVEFVENPELVIGPNPVKAGESVFVDVQNNFDESATIELINLTGKVVFLNTIESTSGEEDFELHTGDLNLIAGFYIIKATTSSGIILTQKLCVVE